MRVPGNRSRIGGMNRRKFIETSIATATIASLPGRAFAATHHIEKVGVQLYTVRDQMKTDFAGTIAKVASIGYKELEFASYFDHSAKEIRGIIDQNGLTAPSCHISYEDTEKHLAERIDAAKIIGHDYLVCPALDDRKKPEAYKRAVELFNKAGETTKKAGIQFCYHNHFWEFEADTRIDGKFAYDYLLENCDASNLKMEMDLCWIRVAGQDPLAYFKKYPGRFPLVHVKDLKKFPKVTPETLDNLKTDAVMPEMTSVGSGATDWKKIFAKSDEAGIKHYFVEQDEGPDRFASLQASYNYLSKLQF